MKKIVRMGFSLLPIAAAVMVFTACQQDGANNNNNDNTPAISGEKGSALISSLKIARFPVTLGEPWTTTEGAGEGSVTITGPWTDAVAPNPKISIIHSPNAWTIPATAGISTAWTLAVPITPPLRNVCG